jgi:hypothetical protein
MCFWRQPEQDSLANMCCCRHAGIVSAPTHRCFRTRPWLARCCWQRFPTAGSPRQYELAFSRPTGRWLPFGTLEVTQTTYRGRDLDLSFDPVLNVVPGLETYHWAAQLRRFSYAASRRAREHRNAEDQKPDIPRKLPTKIVPQMMDAKYLVVDQPLHALGILVGRACTRQPPGWPEQINCATNRWQVNWLNPDRLRERRLILRRHRRRSASAG